MGRRNKYTTQFKARVAFEAAKGDRSINEIAAEYGIHPRQVRARKRELLEKMHLIFEESTGTAAADLQEELEKVFQEIKRLERERDSLIRAVEEALSKQERVEMLRKRQIPKGLSLKRACELLKVARSVVYYKPAGESEENLRLMEEIKRLHSKDPSLGYRRMRAILEKETGLKINHKRVRRLMKLMGLKGTPKTKA